MRRDESYADLHTQRRKRAFILVGKSISGIGGCGVAEFRYGKLEDTYGNV